MRIGTDYLFTVAASGYDFCQIQLLVTDDLAYYLDRLGLRNGAKAYSFGTEGKKITHRLLFSNKHLSHSIISHELEHCKNYILWVAGVRASRINDEADAYLMDWISRWVYRKLKQAKLEVKTL